MEHNEITEQLEKIEALRNAYEVECKRFENSNEAIRAFHTWHMAAVELFLELFGEEDEQLKNFHSEGIPGNGYVLRDEYHAILGTYTMLKVRVKKYSTHNTTKNMQGQEKNIKPKKIFISHSSEDKEFAKALVNLLMLMGFSQQEIYCSSVPGVWITDGKDFLDDIKNQFTKHNLFVIFIQSPRFYGSHIALCEMGATWVGSHEFSSFLTSDMPFGDIDAVVRSSLVAVKVNDADSEARMNDWKNRILKWFGKAPLDDNLWMSQSRDFLKIANSFTYAQSSEDASNDEKLSEADEERLKMWIDSGDDKLYQTWSEGGSAFFGLGAKYVFPVESGPEMSKWNGFFKRMLKLGLMEQSGYTKNGKHPAYRLTEKAYEYFER